MRALCVLVCLAALAVPAAAQGQAPRLWVVPAADAKLVVRGSAFAPRERLLVKLVGVGVSSKRIVAGTTGSFRVSLAKPEPQACGRYVLSVRRASGKTVTLKLGSNECADQGASG